MRSLLKLTRLAVTLATQPPSKRSLRIGDVVAAGEHRHADRIDRGERPADQLLDQVDVVDHQVEHHVDVGAALLEGREPVRFDEQGPVEHVGERQQRGIEALEMADLEDPLARRRRARSARSASARLAAIGFSTSTCRPPSSRRLATAKCAAGRHRDARGLGKARQVARIGQRRERPGASPRPRAARRVAIDHRDQLGAPAQAAYFSA